MNKEHLMNYLVAWLELKSAEDEEWISRLIIWFCEEHGINIYEYVEWTIDENENPIFDWEK